MSIWHVGGAGTRRRHAPGDAGERGQGHSRRPLPDVRGHTRAEQDRPLPLTRSITAVLYTVTGSIARALPPSYHEYRSTARVGVR